MARSAGDARDDAQRASFGEQHRPLLDVHLDVRADAAGVDGGLADARRIEAGREHGVAERDAVRVAAIEQRGIESAQHRAAREEAGAEARALLVGERGHLDRVRDALAARMELGDAGDRHEDAEHAVVASAVPHRIEVRAQENAGRAGIRRLVASDHASDGVDAHAHARFLHPARDLARRRPVRGGEIGARVVVRRVAVARELGGAVEERAPERRTRWRGGVHGVGAV